ncbi:serine/threonine protein kinase [bacterium]|nr:serine/threonine protein kinase [candidate division CSSED10-310 bacterium]
MAFAGEHDREFISMSAVESAGRFTTTRPIRRAVPVARTTREEAAPWREGKVLLDEYVIERFIGTGGTGSLFLVRRRADETPLAVKTLRTSLLCDDEVSRSFLRELRMWIDLPEHPNLLSAFFFKTIEDRLAIFCEYADEGSLRDWIGDGRIHTLRLILDIAVQTAWGLEAAHRVGVVHQDVKPGNILMTSAGLAKVTDFGLARALSTGQRTCRIAQGVESGGMTAAYCSPEQHRQEQVTIKTDVWSWAVSILELFTGPATWSSGTMAPAILRELRAGGQKSDLPALPEIMASLLAHCLEPEPANRMGNLGDAARQLIQLYRDLIGTDFPRSQPTFHTSYTVLSAFRRTNVTGKSWIAPQQWLETAYREAGYPRHQTPDEHPEDARTARSQSLMDLEMYEEARLLLHRLIDQGRNDLCGTLADLQLNRALILESMDDFPGELQAIESAIALRRASARNDAQPETAAGLAAAMKAKANTLGTMGQCEKALEWYDRAIAILEPLAQETPDPRFAHLLAQTYLSKAVTESDLGRGETADSIYDRSIAIYEQLFANHNRSEWRHDLAIAYMNKGSSLTDLKRHAEAIEFCDKGIEALRQLATDAPIPEHTYLHGVMLLNKGQSMLELNQYSEAAALVDQAITIWRKMIETHYRSEVNLSLAISYQCRADIEQAMGAPKAAVPFMDASLEVLDTLVNRDGRTELLGTLADYRVKRAELLTATNELEEARRDLSQAMPLLALEQHRNDTDKLRTTISRAHSLMKRLNSDSSFSPEKSRASLP